MDGQDDQDILLVLSSVAAAACPELACGEPAEPAEWVSAASSVHYRRHAGHYRVLRSFLSNLSRNLLIFNNPK